MKEFYELLKQELSKARKSVKIASPWIDQCMLEKLLEVLPNGVYLEVILRADRLSDLDITKEGTFKTLEKYGAEVYLSERLHAKLVIVDEEVAFVGSANLTRAGLEEEGNLEAVVVLRGSEVEKFLQLFEECKKSSVKLYRDVCGVVVKVESAVEALAVLFEPLPLQSLIWVQKERYRVLCRLTGIYSPDTFQESKLLSESRLWLSAYLRTLLKGSVRFGKVKVLFELGEESERYFVTPLSALAPGDLLFPVREGDPGMEKVIKASRSGYTMDLPVRVGRLAGTSLHAYVDLARISSMHMAVLGTTGSGKTTFLARLIEGIPPGVCNTYIFDLFGEYRQKLQIEEERIFYVEVSPTLLPLSAEDIKELFREYGFPLQERTEEEKLFISQVRASIRPDLRLSSYGEKGLGEILMESSRGGLRREVLELIGLISGEEPQDILHNQPQVFDMLKSALTTQADVVVVDLSKVLHTFTRLNLTGLLLKEILYLAREKPYRRLVVLEEAHNFAPERGAMETPSGRENLAVNMTKRIALEGRKSSLGLVAVSQRPANLSKYVLSQLNTQAIFRLITHNDLEAVSQFFDFPSRDQLELLPSLMPGHCFLNGVGIPFSMLIEIEL